MSEQTPNRWRLRLATADYEKLRSKILERDGWKCQRCGRPDQLQIHHITRRSQSGGDCEGNLIVLCSRCHRYYAPPPMRPFFQEVGADPGKLRIAFTTTAPSGVPIHADCVRAVHEAAKLCAELGHAVNEAAPTVDAECLVNSFMAVWSVGCAEIIEGAAFLTGRKPTSDQFEELTWVLAQQGRAISGPAYLLAVNALQSIARQVARFFVNYDIWLTPTLAEPPLPLGSFDARPGNPLHGLQRAVAFVPFTPLCNATGQPAMSVPLFWNAEGLPVGTHFTGRFGDEATLFRLAAQLEAARPWAARCPATVS